MKHYHFGGMQQLFRLALLVASLLPVSQAWTSIGSINTINAKPSFATTLWAKKKKNRASSSAAAGASTKIQVKLLQHIAGTGQAGDVILVSPVFFANKLRPQKLAVKISDEEVQQEKAAKEAKSDALRSQAKALQETLEAFVLDFSDNQTGPDGKKLFGGIGPKKLMEGLKKDCGDFQAFSKQYTKQVSILEVEEEQTLVATEEESTASSNKHHYKDYSKDNTDTDVTTTRVSYVPLPKEDKNTIKHTGVFRMKVSLTKDLFARVKIVVS